MYSDHEKIKAKYNQIQRACRCLTVRELMALKQLELFTSPYGQDQLRLFELEIEKQKALEKRKKKNKRKRNQSKENIDDELK